MLIAIILSIFKVVAFAIKIGNFALTFSSCMKRGCIRVESLHCLVPYFSAVLSEKQKKIVKICAFLSNHTHVQVATSIVQQSGQFFFSVRPWKAHRDQKSKKGIEKILEDLMIGRNCEGTECMMRNQGLEL